MGFHDLASKARYCKSPTEPWVQVVNDNENTGTGCRTGQKTN